MAPAGRRPRRDTGHQLPFVLETIYRELILDHYRRPRNKGALEDPTVTVSMRNPLCGDEVDLMLLVDDDRIAEARFVGQGRSISRRRSR